ncbi:DMT family transporter [Pelosinus baikalensis]|uniref:DMT family transporter n=1 Tax=Pelosinus baikalensis TaxID=2892015 RepID=A0ABS8HV09_9FIRM|nr:DMT family transporter [Pelosinus baikalensis]
MEKLKGRIYLAISFVLAGTSVIAARFVSDSLGTFTITAASLLAALIILLPFYMLRIKQAIPKMSKNDWIMICLQAFFGIFLFRAFLLFGLQNTSSTEAGVLIGAAPVLTSILARTMLKEKSNAKTTGGIICAVLGVLLLQGAQLSNLTAEHVLGNILVVCAAGSESLFNILSRIHSLSEISGNMDKIEPTVQSLLVSAVAFLFCIIPAAFEYPVSSLLLLDLKGWVSILWYGLIVTMLSYVLWYAGIKRCTAHTAAAFSCLMPFTSMLLAFLILKESIETMQWIGGSLVILGVILLADSQAAEKG